MLKNNHKYQKYIIVLRYFIKTITFANRKKLEFNFNEIPTFVGIKIWQEYLQAYKVQEHHI